MTNTDSAVTLINPWSKTPIEVEISSLIPRIQSYPWPDNVREALDGMVDSDEEYVAKAVAMMGPELAGIVILGS